MTRQIFCKKRQKEAEGLEKPPFPTALGQRIYAEISQEAWDMWLSHQTMLVNEYRLSLIDPKAKAFLFQEMEKFFFGEGSDKPAGFQDR
ncbi:MAG: oxidative damage protection protein [Gammaproteobacteria bacterium]